MFLAGRLRFVILFAAVFFIVAFFRWNGRSSLFEMAVYEVNGRVIEIGENTFLPYGDTEKAKKKVIELQGDRAELLRKLALAEETNRRLAFLSDLSGKGYANATDSVRCRVVGRTPGSWNREVVVNAGKAEGVGKNYIALTGDGIIGTVIEVTVSTSIIRLITGNGVAVSGVVRESPIYGIIYGDGTGRLNMKMVPSYVSIKEGDMVVTSGLGGKYPVGLPIGKVRKVIHDERKLSPVVEIAPAADLVNLSYILLLEPEWQTDTGQ